MRSLLNARQVLMHPFVAGEVLLGSLADRHGVKSIMASLEKVAPLPDLVVQGNLERWGAYKRGVGYIDVHLMSSADSLRCRLWTRDKRLSVLADQLGLRFVEP